MKLKYMNEKDSHLLQEVQSEVALLSTGLNKLLETDIKLSDTIEKASGWLFFLAVTGGLIAIFSAFWIAVVSLTLALSACFLLVYKSKTNLMERIDVNFWFLERGMKLAGKCSSLESGESTTIASNEFSIAVIDCKQDLITLMDDLEAVLNNLLTASLLKYYEERESRGRYTAAMKNKYNRHGIQEPF